ncbi:fumarylacetoacetate hydrolase family protein [Nocardia sp. ET3-3]|uniref:Fumarylacetoacetate hydrolase family protein n=1 Tax=Nocardia terrae TaxID=2675851 RepID=A0A7K1V3X9_9NOCA|nr:fumarylacetoacetate hydrolase family protein [Nocardia terrae]MVU81325.1 fumarylacetoacetate hydrolase family protein [Nocardia terrae]
MKIGRILLETADGPMPRLVSVHPERKLVLDLAAAYRRQLMADGASPRMAVRMAAAQFPGSLTEALETGSAFTDAIARLHAGLDERDGIPLSDVRWLAPVDPPVLRDFNAFKNHEATAPDVWFEVPLFFKINPSTIVGPDESVVWPFGCEHLDYELELGLVIGGSHRDLTPENARQALFGVTVFNDFSARNLLRYEMDGRLGPAKGKDFCTALGPWVVTVDELDLTDLQMRATINGEQWSEGNSGSLVWSIEEILSYASRSEPLVAGEVIGTGTVAGGSGWELGRKLEPGDVVTLTISGIGSLTNTVGKPETGGWRPQARERAMAR